MSVRKVAKTNTVPYVDYCTVE